MKKPPFEKCPTCEELGEDGKLIWKEGISKRTGEKYGFFGCSNYAIGCRYIYESRNQRSDNIIGN